MRTYLDPEVVEIEEQTSDDGDGTGAGLYDDGRGDGRAFSDTGDERNKYCNDTGDGYCYGDGHGGGYGRPGPNNYDDDED